MSLTASELALLKSHAVPLHGIPSDFDSMIKTVRERNAEFVLIGEASHGTAEFYRTRAELTKRLGGRQPLFVWMHRIRLTICPLSHQIRDHYAFYFSPWMLFLRP